MTQPKHTPLPWAYMRIEKTYTAHDGRYVTVATVYQGDKAIARCHNVEDADFIVRACNSHYELLNGMKEILSLSDLDMADGDKAREIAAREIAKAEGGAE